LVSDRLAQLFSPLLRHPARKHAGRHAARLQHNDLTRTRHDAVEEHLRDLRRFARTGRGTKDQTRLGFRRLDDAVLNLVNGQLPR
jgi:hypothetical protein